MDFGQRLNIGKLGESKIAMWLRWRGWDILPVYEKEIDEGKGPQFFTASFGNLIAPDILAIKQVEAIWIEAKHKSVFSWHRISQQWVTGIDIKHYESYLKINEISPWPVWLFFLHQKDRIAKRNEPWPCPVGLFGDTLNNLCSKENHRHNNWGNTGMVYWAKDSLKKLATLKEIDQATREYTERLCQLSYQQNRVNGR